jgi:hypothetical protein
MGDGQYNDEARAGRRITCRYETGGPFLAVVAASDRLPAPR